MSHNKRTVVKRDGSHQPLSFDKILYRIENLCFGLNNVDSSAVAQQVISYITDGISTVELDRLAAETASFMSTQTQEYNVLASHIAVSSLHKETDKDWKTLVSALYHRELHGVQRPAVSKAFYDAVMAHGDKLQAAIDYKRDYNFDYFGFKTLERGYLLKLGDRIVERPQHLYMRVALGIQIPFAAGTEWTPDSLDIDQVIATYDMLSQHYYTHATPTMFNAGTVNNQLASCFLMNIGDDSIESIFDSVKNCAKLSKGAGGIGLSVHCIRNQGSYIAGTNGESNGLVPMLKVFQETAMYVDQCFPMTTRVHTQRGLVSLADLKTDHKILTSDGRCNSMAKLIKHTNVDATMVKAYLFGASKPVIVTPEHPFLAIRQSPNILASLNQGTRHAEYLTMEELVVGDYLVYSVPKFHSDTTTPVTWLFIRGVFDTANQVPDGWEMYFGGQTSGTIDALKLCNFLGDMGVVAEYMGGAEELTMTVRRSMLPMSFLNWMNEPLDSLELPERHWMEFFKGICVNVKCQPTEVGIHIRDIPQCALSQALPSDAQTWLLRAGLVCHCGAIDEGLMILWNDALLTWWEQSEREVPKQVLYKVPRYGNTLMVPLEHVEMTDQVARNEELGDLEMVHDPHDYNTEYGVVHNGGGKRAGSFCVYLEPWHPDIFDFLQMKRPTGNENRKARHLFYALWVPDLFMRRVAEQGTWSLFDPNAILPIQLQEIHGAEFEQAYLALEAAGKFHSQVDALKLWQAIIECQMETGMPFMLYKDSCNAKNNQKNLGTIKSSNLCTEIMEYTSADQVATCNLASIALPKFVKPASDGGVKSFDFDHFRTTVEFIVTNLNHVINNTKYVLDSTKSSNLNNRPMGLGVQGLADVFFMLNMPYDSAEAKVLNKRIFKHMYFAATRASMLVAQHQGPYESFAGSPASQGILQPDMWDEDLSGDLDAEGLDWDGLRSQVKKHGLRNSLLIALMPTASTAQIMNNVECFEAQSSNLYTRRVLSGNFIVVNKHLVAELTRRGLWNKDLSDRIIMADGSVNIPGVPDDLKSVYKTVWEIKQKTILDMARDRAPFVDQSQSLNIFLDAPDSNRLTSVHMYGWKIGLKTGMYYLRSKPAASAIKSTIQTDALGKTKETELKVEKPKFICTEDVCTMCSS